MQAIKTVYLGPTDTRGSCIKATAENGASITIDYPHERNTGADAHSVAAVALCHKLGWDGKLIAGALKDCYVFVFAESQPVYDIGLTDEEKSEAKRKQQERLDAILGVATMNAEG